MTTKINPKQLYTLREVAMPSDYNSKGLGLIQYKYAKVYKLANSYFKNVVVVERSARKHGSRYFLYGKDIMKFLKARIRDVG